MQQWNLQTKLDKNRSHMDVAITFYKYSNQKQSNEIGQDNVHSSTILQHV